MKTTSILTIATWATCFFLTFTAYGQQSKKQHDFKEISEKEIKYKDLPKAVQSAFEKSKYKDWEIEEMEKVETDKGTMYELEVESSDEKYIEIYFDPKGKIAATEEEEHGEHEEENH